MRLPWPRCRRPCATRPGRRSTCRPASTTGFRLLTIYKTYPVYAPGREPAGYMERLRQVEPEIVFDPDRLHTHRDWAKAGEAIFDAPTFFAEPRPGAWSIHSSFPAAGVPVAADGTYPFVRYVIRKKGEVELGGNSCAWCHTRVMPDGSVVKGAQGNFPARPRARRKPAGTRQNRARSRDDRAVVTVNETRFCAASTPLPGSRRIPMSAWPGCPWRNW